MIWLQYVNSSSVRLLPHFTDVKKAFTPSEKLVVACECFRRPVIVAVMAEDF